MYNIIIDKIPKEGDELMTVRELDKLIRNDGWYLVKQVGSHMQHKHPTKAGKSNDT